MFIKRLYVRRRLCFGWSKRVYVVLFIIALVFIFLRSQTLLTSEVTNLDDNNRHPRNVRVAKGSSSPTSKDSDSHYDVNKGTVFKKGQPGAFEFIPPPLPVVKGPGEEGKGVSTDTGSVEVRVAVQKYGFNTIASDKISLNRTIKDTRPSECKYWHYQRQLPTASVIIVFHNEGWSPLLRTVHSVLLRSPPDLLREVLLIDDFSTRDHLRGPLDEQVAKYAGKVRLLRNSKREGLIGSRSRGAAEAYGDVVVFLDAHCEANSNWLPPLLAPIAANRKLMTVPFIDSIDMNTWAYHAQYAYSGTGLFRGIFEWGLLYKETEIPDQEMKTRVHNTEPVKAPTHAGGLFAIDRKWFEQLGFYDPGLKIWGGENFELSFKIWQCGGGVYWVPCSRVGHVYRNHMPYDFGGLSGPVISTNYKRVAEVWMDEYKDYYYRREPFMFYRDAGDLSEQKQLREKNKCKSFKWFMDNVAYDVIPQYPLPPKNLYWGEVVNEAASMCLDTLGRPTNGNLGASGCHHYGGNQLYRINAEGQLATGEWCVTPRRGEMKTGYCRKGSVDGPWRYDLNTQQLKEVKSGRCLTLVMETNDVKLQSCKAGAESQKWTWKELKI